MYQKIKYPFSWHLPKHSIEFDVEKFISYRFNKIIKQYNMEKSITFSISNEKNNIPIAVNNNNKITFYKEPINYILGVFETESARKCWLLLMMFHELMHSIYPNNGFKNNFEYEDFINKKARRALAKNVKKYTIKTIESEYCRWGKYVNYDIWYLLSFGEIENWYISKK